MKKMAILLGILGLGLVAITFGASGKREINVLKPGDTVVVNLLGDVYSVMMSSDEKNAIIYVTSKSVRRCELLLGQDGTLQNSLFVSGPDGMDSEVIDRDGDGVPEVRVQKQEGKKTTVHYWKGGWSGEK